jgi:hypothetical protein
VASSSTSHGLTERLRRRACAVVSTDPIREVNQGERGTNVRPFRRFDLVRLSLLTATACAFWLFSTGVASAAPPTAPFHECPPIGADSGCAILIYIDDNGAQILTDGSQPVYDGIEDTLIGVLNDTTGTTISSIPLTGTSDVFAFDGDGICSPNNSTSPFSPGSPGSNSGVGPCTGNANDTSNGGYGGPDGFFTDINGSFTTGTVNFSTPIAPGHSDFFSLEGAINGSDINVVTATGTSISAVEGNAFTGLVATFHATDTSTAAGDYSASIDWGDGSTSTGSISGGSGTFTVNGTHTFADEGSSTQATVTIKQTSNNTTTTVKDPVTVTDAPLTAGTLTATGGVEGVTPGTASLTFTDGNPTATTADFASGVSCDWGDGTTTSGAVTDPVAGTFTASCTGGHIYAEEGSNTVTVKVTDDGGQTTSKSGLVTTADAPLTSSCAAAAVSPQAFTGPTASFADADPAGVATDYTVSIDWGDGTTSSGVASGPSGGSFTASGSHTYTSTGYFTIKTKITDHMATTTATCTTLIFAFAPGGGSFVIGNGNSATGTAVNFWGAQWWKNNTLSGGTAPAAFKGFALNPTTPSCGTSWSTDPGNSAPPPAGPLPAFMGVIVSSSISKSGSLISGNTPDIVVVQTNAGYAPNPGHAGTGTVVATFC